MAKGSTFFVAFFCALSMPLTACTPEGPRVDVTIKFVAKPGTPDLSAAMVQAGYQQRQTAPIAAGAEQTAILFPGEFYPHPTFTVSTRIHLRNVAGRANSEWQSELLSIDKSYLFHLRVNEKGEVIGQRSCVMPCELWAKPQAVEGAAR